MQNTFIKDEEPATKKIKHRRNYVALLAAGWALIFGMLHVCWGMGIYVALPDEEAKQAFERNWFQLYNWIAASLCMFAVCLAMALYRSTARKKHWIRGLIFCCAVILTLRGLAAVLLSVYLHFARELNTNSANFWDYWFLLGGFLFFMSFWDLKISRFFSGRVERPS